jgi:FRG domain
MKVQMSENGFWLQERSSIPDWRSKDVPSLFRLRSGHEHSALVQYAFRKAGRGPGRRGASSSGKSRNKLSERKTGVQGLKRGKLKMSQSTFPSLAACIAFIDKEFPQSEITLPVKSINEPYHVIGKQQQPAYLYRGESEFHPTTPSFYERVKNDPKWNTVDVKQLEDIVVFASMDFDRIFQLGPALSGAFIQHYGGPSTIMDLTGNVQVAAHFASYAKTGTVGSFAVITSSTLAKKMQLLDLTIHPIADRPVKQKAFGLMASTGFNLKNPVTVSSLNISWFKFTLTANDKATFYNHSYYIDDASDKCLGLMALFVDTYRRNNGPIRLNVARLLAKYVYPADFLIDADRNWLPPGMPVDDSDLANRRLAKLRYWADDPNASWQ